MMIRAFLAFLTLPGVVAGVIPLLIVRFAALEPRSAPFGIALLGVGTFLLLWCVRDFFVSGKGTLAPWDPPRHLVVVGLYRCVRNPMYVAVLTLIAGWSLLYHSAWIGLYLGVMAAVFHLRVILNEEPWLRRQFGDEWVTYAATVPRWLPGLRRKVR